MFNLLIKVGKSSCCSQVFGLHDDRFVSICLCPNIMRVNKMLICKAVFPFIQSALSISSCLAQKVGSCLVFAFCFLLSPPLLLSLCWHDLQEPKTMYSNSAIWDYFLLSWSLLGLAMGWLIADQTYDLTSGISISVFHVLIVSISDIFHPSLIPLKDLFRKCLIWFIFCCFYSCSLSSTLGSTIPSASLLPSPPASVVFTVGQWLTVAFPPLPNQWHWARAANWIGLEV